MIPLAIPNLEGNEKRYLCECIDDGFVSSVGEFVNRLELDAAKATGSVATVATSAGTTALHASLIVLGVRPDDLVIVPSFTFIASANSIRHAGAYPWFIDVDPESWCISAKQLAIELDEKTVVKGGDVYHKATGRRVAAIMPVYTLGNIPDMDEINCIAASYGLPVLADAACAIGATYKGLPIGGLATLSAISLNGNKTVTAGGGGLICGQDESLLNEAKHITTTARVWPGYDFDMVGYNYRLTNLQAAVACAQLERLEQFLQVKRRVRRLYNESFAGLSGIKAFPTPEFCESSAWFSGFVCENSDAARIVSALNDMGVGAKAFWKPVHLQAPYLECVRASSLDVTESVWDKVVTLPCSTIITDDELHVVVDAVKSVLGA